MNRRGHRGRTDANHGVVIEALRKAGWCVISLAQVGDGCPDAIAAKHGRIELIEIKDGRKRPSERKLTPDEVTFHQRLLAAGVTVKVITDVDGATRL
jgi:Holliday junction resolvase